MRHFFVAAILWSASTDGGPQYTQEERNAIEFLASAEDQLRSATEAATFADWDFQGPML
jgi:hypothetical protein